MRGRLLPKLSGWTKRAGVARDPVLNLKDPLPFGTRVEHKDDGEDLVVPRTFDQAVDSKKSIFQRLEEWLTWGSKRKA